MSTTVGPPGRQHEALPPPVDSHRPQQWPSAVARQPAFAPSSRASTAAPAPRRRRAPVLGVVPRRTCARSRRTAAGRVTAPRRRCRAASTTGPRASAARRPDQATVRPLHRPWPGAPRRRRARRRRRDGERVDDGRPTSSAGPASHGDVETARRPGGGAGRSGSTISSIRSGVRPAGPTRTERCRKVTVMGATVSRGDRRRPAGRCRTRRRTPPDPTPAARAGAACRPGPGPGAEVTARGGRASRWTLGSTSCAPAIQAVPGRRRTPLRAGPQGGRRAGSMPVAR